MSTTSTNDGIKLTYTRTVVLPQGTTTANTIQLAIEAAASGKLDDVLRKHNFYNESAALFCEEAAAVSEVTVTTSYVPKP